MAPSEDGVLRVLQRCGYWRAAVVATAYLAWLLGPHAPIKLAPLPSACRHFGDVADESQDAWCTGRLKLKSVRVACYKLCVEQSWGSMGQRAPVDLMLEGRNFTSCNMCRQMRLRLHR